jgi:hypothetical protein
MLNKYEIEIPNQIKLDKMRRKLYIKSGGVK